YRERFADASDFTFTFVGNFDETKIKSYIQTYLGDLPSINREETWKDIGVKAVKGGVTDHIKNGVAPKTNVEMFFHGDFDYNRNNNYVMSSMLAYLRIKLRETLREELGGVYGVRVSGGGSKKPREEYSITVSFNSDPPMTDKLVQAAKDVIATALAEGPSEEDMVKVKETQRQNRTKGLEENRFWQRQISLESDNDKEFDMILLDSYEKQVDALTSKQIQDAIGQYFNYNNYIEIIMAPEDKPVRP
ncbi:insulinase family protein, partial [Saprospiraceae bacterium]|nr:insulinase family protein [Saprospiraceae bacterium]